ncbi:hypothetical protein PIROE2DRAFT_14066 [Piromyces sp. E2]|nr:hypothetical protein PIROE2DRAFT_14066 [Piromyces sp. E2]|eukprot:OUM60247.1 hypothetical protein PIROE2DRAFT_14066 [Piromyces sp. E2]
MRFNSFVISSLLALCVTAKAIDEKVEKVVVDDKLVNEKILPTRIITEIPIKPTILPIKKCPLGKGVVREQLLQCNKLNGKFYSKFHPYPDCYSDYVCFLPDNGTKKIIALKNCINIEDKIYCSADISNIRYCRPELRSYDFKQCVSEASKLFPNFTYRPVIRPTIMPPPLRTTIMPPPPRTIIKPTILPPPPKTTIIKPPIIRPTVVPLPMKEKEEKL